MREPIPAVRTRCSECGVAILALALPALCSPSCAARRARRKAGLAPVASAGPAKSQLDLFGKGGK